jgi:tetratricopeptide (TPR) repeat protein
LIRQKFIIEQAIKKYPANLYYQIDKGLIYEQKNDKDRSRKYFEKLIADISDDPFKVRVASQHFTKQQLFDYALLIYQASRKKMNDPTAYSIQMASLYRLLNKKEEMINEYLNYVNENPQNVRSVENNFSECASG